MSGDCFLGKGKRAARPHVPREMSRCRPPVRQPQAPALWTERGIAGHVGALPDPLTRACLSGPHSETRMEGGASAWWEWVTQQIRNSPFPRAQVGFCLLASVLEPGA